jgi:hypothetical protein
VGDDQRIFGFHSNILVYDKLVKGFLGTRLLSRVKMQLFIRKNR